MLRCSTAPLHGNASSGETLSSATGTASTALVAGSLTVGSNFLNRLRLPLSTYLNASEREITVRISCQPYEQRMAQQRLNGHVNCGHCGPSYG